MLESRHCTAVGLGEILVPYHVVYYLNVYTQRGIGSEHRGGMDGVGPQQLPLPYPRSEQYLSVLIGIIIAVQEL